MTHCRRGGFSGIAFAPPGFSQPIAELGLFFILTLLYPDHADQLPGESDRKHLRAFARMSEEGEPDVSVIERVGMLHACEVARYAFVVDEVADRDGIILAKRTQEKARRLESSGHRRVHAQTEDGFPSPSRIKCPPDRWAGGSLVGRYSAGFAGTI